MRSEVRAGSVMVICGFECVCALGIYAYGGASLVVGVEIGSVSLCVRLDTSLSAVKYVAVPGCYDAWHLVGASAYVSVSPSTLFLVLLVGCCNIDWTGDSQVKSSIKSCTGAS